jgi:competence protein ComEC
MTVDLRLAIATAVAWTATALVIGMPNAAVPALSALWVLAALCVAGTMVRRRSWLTLVALAAVAAALCCTSIAIRSPSRQPDVLLDAADSGHRVTATAIATEAVSPGAEYFAVELTHVAVARGSLDTSVPVLALVDHSDRRSAAERDGRSVEHFGVGTALELTGTLIAAEPGDDIAFLFFVDGSPRLIGQPPWSLDWANALRAGFAADTESLPGDGGDLLPGLAIGDTSAVSDQLDAAMKTSSLSHLTAVSGANCAIVIGLIMLAGGAIGWPRMARVTASLAVLVAFVVLVTPEPSVLRAALMAVLVLAAVARGRPVQGVPVLAFAALILLVLDPWLARNYGFILSVLATGGLLLLAGPLARVLARWVPRWLAVVIAVPLAAQIACQPVIILLDASLPTYGVIANLLAEPAAPVATVIGLASCVALPFAPALGTFLGQLAWLPSAWIAAVAEFFAGLPGARLPWPGGVLGVSLLVLVSTLALVAVLWRGAWRRWIALAFVLVLVGYAGVVGGGRVATELSRPDDWQIAACDVGQGDALVVRSAGRIALFDTGPDPKPTAACLKDLGIQRIDLFVLTHFHLDHYGGVSALSGMVDEAFVGPSSGPGDDRVVAEIVAGGAHVQQVEAGLSGTLGDLRWQVLWPPHNIAGIELGNPSSVAVEFQPVGECARGCLSSVFLGDLTERPQSRIVTAVVQGRVDVVKVGHHGSADQSEALYDRLQATVGIISVGAGNDYGHPADSLLAILQRAGTLAQRTDQRGLILLSPGDTPSTVDVWSEH